MTLPREAHRDRLRELIRDIMESSLPVMCHDASGIASPSAIYELQGELRDGVERELAQCAQRRNARLAVHALPADVLRIVAGYSAYNARADAATVCSHWRAALVGDHRLWRDDAVWFWTGFGGQVDATSASAVVRRAGGALASLAIQSPHELLEDALLLPIVSSVLGRLRHLTVDLVPADEGAWTQIFAHPAPELHTLRVMRYALASVYALPQTLFAGVAPSLRTVLLHCCVTPAAPCPAFARVTTLGYFRFAKLTAGEVSNALALAPHLERLVAGAWAYDAAADFAGWTLGPAFRALCVQKVVGDGVFGALARRARSLVVHEPLPLYADVLVLRCDPIARLAVRWLGPGDRLTVALAPAEDGAECVVARVTPAFVSAFLRRHLPTLRSATQLLLPDSFWLELCALPAPPVWPSLVHLTLCLALSGPSAAAQYTHTFVLQAVPLADACPHLAIVHLVHTGHRGTAAREYLRVSAEHAARWLTATVQCLKTSGIILSDPGLDALLAQVAHEIVPEPGEPYTVEDENEWEWTFPFDDALQL